ncbi:hypothetical protein NP493_439g02020 [Ridgeia piscesae]|uniref:NGFI-A-binding protein homolog n=1 Tax=Ridgeia piscesae TaxID=27915 RepID=A0AAD9L013_RIDPI|nr:hypothetical protein NP493_439g02020 [Ridgeia piscesae]
MTTSRPTNESELQQYRVLERANLLQYYDTFISQGGDDVRQLCEAGEEEFLEIMALVGMASKPLHVRRLQKALQEWVSNPAMFQRPLDSPRTVKPVSTQSISPHAGGVVTQHSPVPYRNPPSSTATPIQAAAAAATAIVVMPTTSGSSSGLWPLPTTQSISAAHSPASDTVINTMTGSPPAGCSSNKSASTPSSNGTGRQCESPSPGVAGGSPYPPKLSDAQLWAIEKVATEVAQLLPAYEAKSVNMKKDISLELQELIDSVEDTPDRLAKIRKYAAIYGRFDSKRKNENNMSLHEVSVNEAAAQLCRHVPTLLTRRNDLFPLARQVVRDSGYQYSKGRSRAQRIDIAPDSKRVKHESAVHQSPDGTVKVSRAELEKLKRESRMTEINKELSDITTQQAELKSKVNKAKNASDSSLVADLQGELESLTTRQLDLLTEQSEIIKKQRCVQRQLWVKHQLEGSYVGESSVYDDVDSLNGISGMSSPGNSDDEFEETVDFSKAEFHENAADDQEQLGAGATESNCPQEGRETLVVKTEESGEWTEELDTGVGTRGRVVKTEVVSGEAQS